MRPPAEAGMPRVTRRIALLSAARLSGGAAFALPLAAACSSPDTSRSASASSAGPSKATLEARGVLPQQAARPAEASASKEPVWPFPDVRVSTPPGYTAKLEPGKVTFLGPVANEIQSTVTLLSSPVLPGETLQAFAVRRAGIDMPNAAGLASAFEAVGNLQRPTDPEEEARKITGARHDGPDGKGWVAYEGIFFKHNGKGYSIVYKGAQDAPPSPMNRLKLNMTLR